MESRGPNMFADRDEIAGLCRAQFALRAGDQQVIQKPDDNHGCANGRIDDAANDKDGGDRFKLACVARHRRDAKGTGWAAFPPHHTSRNRHSPYRSGAFRNIDPSE